MRCEHDRAPLGQAPLGLDAAGASRRGSRAAAGAGARAGDPGARRARARASRAGARARAPRGGRGRAGARPRRPARRGPAGSRRRRPPRRRGWASSSSPRRRRRAACGRCGGRPTRSPARRAGRPCGRGSRRRSTAGRPASRRRARRSPPRPRPPPRGPPSARTIAGAAWRSCTGAKAHTSRPAQPRRASAASTSSRALPPSPVITPIVRGSSGRGRRFWRLEQALGVELPAQALDPRQQVSVAGEAQVAHREGEARGGGGAAGVVVAAAGHHHLHALRRRAPRARSSPPSPRARPRRGSRRSASRSSKYTRARDGRRFTSSPTSCTRAKERSFDAQRRRVLADRIRARQRAVRVCPAAAGAAGERRRGHATQDRRYDRRRCGAANPGLALTERRGQAQQRPSRTLAQAPARLRRSAQRGHGAASTGPAARRARPARAARGAARPT